MVLTRKVNERILIGDDIIIELVQVGSRQVRIGITAPRDMLVIREELKGEDHGYKKPAKPA